MNNNQSSKAEQGMERYFFRASAADFKKIPGSPIAYWVSKGVLTAFESFPQIREVCEPKSGLSTTDNNRFLRLWHEVDFEGIPFEICDTSETDDANYRWCPFSKGGDYRKWEGNREHVVNWWHNGSEIREATKDAAGGRIVSPEFYFKTGITWSAISSSKPSMRMIHNAIFGSGGKGLFTKGEDHFYLGYLNSKIALYCLGLLSPTLNYEAGHIGSLPITTSSNAKIESSKRIPRLIDLSKADWDSYETSWDFTSLPLLNPDYRQPTLKATYQKLRANWRELTLKMRRLEEENNRIFIEAYGLQDELTPEVPLNEITLTCNPHYRYGNDKCEEELEALLLADTMRELVSYAVGCMFGRYALEKPGLILANQDEGIDDFRRKIFDLEKEEEGNPNQKSAINNQKFEIAFPPDEENVIPLLDGDWFTDDITERFKRFLRVAFGGEHYEENLQFVEDGLGKDIRKYFLKDFYTDHVKRYKKRPIYWLFSSPKGSFNALIYMHRYRPDTVSVVLNDYLREFRTKLTSHKNHLEAVSISASSSQGEKTKALKEIEKITRMIAEMEEYEREVLYPLATEQVEIDLDDGVKVNYPKFGAALKKINGIELIDG